MSRSSWTSEPREPGADGVRRALQLLDQQVAALAAVDPATPLTKSGEKPYRERRVALRGLLERLGLEDPLPFPDLATWQRRAHKFSPAHREPQLRRWTHQTREDLASLLTGIEAASAMTAWAALLARLDDAQRRADGESDAGQLRAAGRVCLAILDEAVALAPDRDRRLVSRAQALARTPAQARTPTPAQVSRAVQTTREALAALHST